MTSHVYWQEVLWSLAVLCSGYFPYADSKGNAYTADANPEEFGRARFPLAAGLFVVVWGIHCDMDYVANYLHLESYGALQMCPWCCATLTDDPAHPFFAIRDLPIAPWNDLADDAVWRRTQS